MWCGTAESGIWVLKGGRARLSPASFDRLRVEWTKRGTYETAWSRQGTNVCFHTSMNVEQPSDHKLMTPSGMGLLVCGAGSHPFLSLWCTRGDMPTGVNLNRYAGPGSCIRWHSENESLFGPQNQPKLIVSMSLSRSVQFQVRRPPGGVPSPIQLDRGDLLVMDGLAQTEYEHRTVSGLPGPRVFPWVPQHIASCPLCALPACVHGLAEPGPLFGWKRISQWCCFWVMVLLLSIWVCFLLGRTWLDTWRKRFYSGRRPSCPVVLSPRCSLGWGAGVGDCRGGAVSQNAAPCLCLFWAKNHVLLARIWVSWCSFCWMY